MDFDFLNILFTDKWLPISIVVMSPIVALIIDLIFSIVLKSFVGKTKTTLDDKIIDILHQPIFYSLIFIGWMIAISKTPFNYSHYIVSLLLTFIIIIWGKAIFRAFIELIKWYSKRANKNNVFQQRTLPLFDNLGKLAIFLLGVFFVLLVS